MPARTAKKPRAAAALKPPLKWAGGKRWLVPYLKRIWQEQGDRRLVEPFCGGLAVALGLHPRAALLGDINPHLINFYRWIRRGLELTIPMENDGTLYYAQRSRFNDLISCRETVNSSEAAQLFYYLNRTGYNGLCRFNKKGKFNVPFGRYKRIRYMVSFAEYQAVFANWEFKTGDFAAMSLEPADFVYADPPYDVPFTRYSQRDFAWEDQVRLAHWLAAHPGPVVLSNQATERVVELYTSLGYSLQYLEAPRRIACTGDRTPAREVLATRNITTDI